MEDFMNILDRTKVLLKKLIPSNKKDDCTCHTGKCGCEQKNKEEHLGKKPRN